MSRKETAPATTDGAGGTSTAAGTMVPWTAPGPIASGTDGDEARKGTAAANPTLVIPAGSRTPEQIEAELARTRADLEQTLDELSARLNPRSLARRAGLAARARVLDPETGRPRTPVMAAGAGTVVLLAGMVVAVRALRRRRS